MCGMQSRPGALIYRSAVCVMLLSASAVSLGTPSDSDIFQLIRSGDTPGVALAVKNNPGLLKARDKQGRTALTQAIFLHRDEIAKFLVAKGSPLTAFDAAALGETSILRNMVGGNRSLLKMKDGAGYTLMMVAAFRHHPETVEMLVAMGAPLDIYGAAALGLTDKIREFISQDSRLIAGAGPAEMTALQVAVSNGSYDAAKLLLDSGADPNAANDFGTALFDAAGRGDADMIKLLLARGARKDFFVAGFGTPYTYALAKGHKEVAELLKP